jgi:hypothetical protein
MAGTESEHIANQPTDGGHLSLGRTVPLRRWYLVATLVMLNLLDVLTTKWVLGRGGSEQNPLLQPIIAHPYAPLLVKLGLCLVIGALVMVAPRRSRFTDVGLIGIVAVYTCVVGWNLGMLIQHALR